MSLESGYMKKERKEKNSLHNHNINPFLLTKTQFLHNFSDIILVLISSVVLYPIKFCLSKKQCVYIYAKVTALYCLAKPVRFFKTPVHNYSKTVWIFSLTGMDIWSESKFLSKVHFPSHFIFLAPWSALAWFLLFIRKI